MFAGGAAGVGLGGQQQQGFDPYAQYTVDLNAWIILYLEERPLINALNELVEIIAVNDWELSTWEYMQVDWQSIDVLQWLPDAETASIIHNNRKNLINHLLDSSRITRQQFAEAREDCCHPYDRLQHLLALRPEMLPDCPNMLAIQKCIELRAGTNVVTATPPQLASLGITAPSPGIVQLGVQTSNSRLHAPPPMLVKPGVDLADHDPGQVPLDTANFEHMRSRDGLYSLTNVDSMLKSFKFTDSSRQKIERGILLNLGFPNDAIPKPTDSLEQLLRDKSYTLTGEKTSPATLRAARLTNAGERNDITQVIVAPADMLNLGAALGKEGLRNGCPLSISDLY